MTKLSELKLKLEKFKEGVDYSFISKPRERIYCFFSEEIKKVVSPFPCEELGNSMEVSRKKVEKDTATGEYFVYEQNADGSEVDKLVITDGNSAESYIGVDERIKQIDRIDERIKQIDRIDERIKQIDRIDERIKEIDAVPAGTTFSFTTRKFNEKGEVVSEDKKISSESPSTTTIQEITDQEAQEIQQQQQQRPFFPKPKGNF
jgi:hypothetical protein